ncbi:MAG: hypothetical protein IH936_13415 [Acidobacteria bacterium]|nr:hypothetical protein [Acidobacteriota bacterium]
MAIHNAVLDGGDRDAYTGEKLDWSLISTYDNKGVQEAGAGLQEDVRAPSNRRPRRRRHREP